jgi:hypothetical protein
MLEETMSEPDEEKEALLDMLRQDAVNRFLGGDLTALDHSVVHRDGCYICRDPEFAVMGLPLCRKCPRCAGHIAADDEVCDDCGCTDNPYSQTGAAGLDPDGWPEMVLDVDDSVLPPYGDYETEEPFLVPLGTVDYAGLPEYFGDLWDAGKKGEGDYVEALHVYPHWRGSVAEVKGFRSNRLSDDDSLSFDERLIPYFEVTECLVRTDAGETVRCKPGWLRVIQDKWMREIGLEVPS